MKTGHCKSTHTSNTLLIALMAASVILAGCSKQEHESLVDTGDTIVLDEDAQVLGTVRFPNSCTADAQPLLQRGLALLHHMTYIKAKETFLEAATVDPECAIAYWGAAMTHVHPLWPDIVPPDLLISGQSLLDQATSAMHTSAREFAYISALQGYYREGQESEMERLHASLDGWEIAHEQNPDDIEASLFYALALISVAPVSDKTLTYQKQAGAITEMVMAEIPEHPGANHYTIHAYDNPPLAVDALETARHYGDVAPENSHALHMTSHIFTRRGLWSESISFNRRAADAARDRTPSGDISMHYMHAIDYLAYAYLQQGNDNQAADVLSEMQALEPPFHNHAASAYALAAVPVRLTLDQHNWEAAAQSAARLPEQFPWDSYPHLVAIPEFARALGAARTGDYALAEEAISELEILQEQAAALDMAYDWGIQVAILKTAAEAWVAYEQGDTEKGVILMRAAAMLELETDKNPVTPSEVLPAMELYGDMLLDIEDYEAARDAYEEALIRSPNRFYSLFGAGFAAEMSGDTDDARNYYRQLLENCPDGNKDREQLEHAREFLG